jgi:hypothetical protein
VGKKVIKPMGKHREALLEHLSGRARFRLPDPAWKIPPEISQHVIQDRKSRQRLRIALVNAVSSKLQKTFFPYPRDDLDPAVNLEERMFIENSARENRKSIIFIKDDVLRSIRL